MFELSKLKTENLKLRGLLMEVLEKINQGRIYAAPNCDLRHLRVSIENELQLGTAAKILSILEKDPDVKSSPLDIWEKALGIVIYELNKFREDLNFLLKDSELIRNAIMQAEHEMRLNLISKFQHQIKETEK